MIDDGPPRPSPGPSPAAAAPSAPPPTLDPSRNRFLSPAGRPLHTPTRMAPPSLLASRADDEGLSLAPEPREEFERTRSCLREILGRPYFADHGFILYRGDSLSLLTTLARSSFRAPLTITSPPYNLGKAYESRLDLDAYLEWCAAWLAQVHATTTRCGALWLNLGHFEVPGRGLCVPIPYLLWNRSDFYLVQEIVWRYGAGVTTKTRFCPRNEKWLFYVRDPKQYLFHLDRVRDPNVKYPQQKKRGRLRCNPLGKNPSDVWDFAKVTTGDKRCSKERTAHPAQSPLGIADRIVKVSSDPLDLVVDPFSGSGTTGIAAVGNGRIYVGFEAREDYCQLSVDRFRRFLAERHPDLGVGARSPGGPGR